LSHPKKRVTSAKASDAVLSLWQKKYGGDRPQQTLARWLKAVRLAFLHPDVGSPERRQQIELKIGRRDRQRPDNLTRID